MDTQFWGPAGWKLLHLTAEGGFPTEDARTFWLLLPYILPCKFCRYSLSEYYKKYPVPTKSADLPKWIWSIHNCVNSKLRGQGLCNQDDPPFEQVHARYKSMFEAGCTITEFPGWIFLFCIADNHPSYNESLPMPNIPAALKNTVEERNQYNLLKPAERLSILKEWFISIPHALPYKEWRESWHKHAKGVHSALKTRKSILSWLWKIQCGMTKDLNWLAKDTYYNLCKKIKEHRSGCGKDVKAKTCRKTKKNMHKK
jgi:hypothetical protein